LRMTETEVSPCLDCMIVSLAISVFLLICAKIMQVRHSRTKLLNKLTLMPFYALLVFLAFLLVQMTVLLLNVRGGRIDLTFYRVLQALKAFAM